MSRCPRTGAQYLVVGCGFLGRRLVTELLDRGETKVRVFDIAPNPFDCDARVEYIRGDVTRPAELRRACEGVDMVYSTFATIRYFERLAHQATLSERVNVGGTQNLLDACAACGVRRLVYTSTSNVSVNPSRCRFGMTEDEPYVPRAASHNHYTWTKAEAERRVLAADGAGALRAVAVRPVSGIFGHGDPLIMGPALRDKSVVLLFPEAKIDYVYVDNVVFGHLLAEAALTDGRDGVGGEAFCISNDEPLHFEELYLAVKRYYPSLQIIYAPRNLLVVLAYVVEAIAWITRDRVPLGQLGLVTPAMLATASMSFSFDCAKARRVLGYRPVYTVDEAVQKSVDDYLASRQ